MWEYNAPQYVDFSKRFDDDRADAYFGMLICVHRLQSHLHFHLTQRASIKESLPNRYSAL